MVLPSKLAFRTSEELVSECRMTIVFDGSLRLFKAFKLLS